MPEQRVMPIHSPPSLKTGFARSAREAKYPQLWNGLIGAWCASLGRTGDVIRDYSGWNNHGTPQNMTAAELWQRYQGSDSWTFPQSTDHIDTTFNPFGFGIGNCTVSLWLRLASFTSFDILFSCGSSNFEAYFNSAGATYFWLSTKAAGSGVNVSSLFSLGNWNHLAYTNEPDGAHVYCNGEHGGLQNQADTLTSNPLAIGNRQTTHGHPTEGNIDGLMVHDRVLSPAEIRMLASQQNIVFERKHRTYSIASAAAPAARNPIIMIS